MAEKDRAGYFARLTTHIPPGQFGRYLLVGVGNTVFGYGSFVLLTVVLTPVIPHAYIVAALISNLLNITFSYINYKWFVFKTKGNYLREWARCLVVYSGGIVGSLVLLPIFVFAIRHSTRFDSSAPYIAGAVLTAMNVLYSFLGHKKFSFRPAE